MAPLPLSLLFAVCAPKANDGEATGGRQVPAVAGAESPVSRMQDYATIPLPTLIGLADLIVAGTVRRVGDEQFDFAVEEVLRGSASGEEVRVAQFVPSKFDNPRAAPYRAGQQFLLFLTSDSEAPGGWKVMGLGGEGEMPVDEGFVYFHGRRLEDLEIGTYTVHGASREIQRHDAADFRASVRGYQLCFRWHAADDQRPRPEPEQICDDAALDAFRSTGAMQERLAAWTVRRLPPS